MTSAFLFPGQGSQSVAMGKALYETSAEARSVYDLADEIFAKQNPGLTKLSEIVFNGPEEELKRTVYTQIAILTLSIALATLLKTKIANGDIAKPAYTAGHSLGEFSALYMADVLSLEDALKLVALRGALMEQAPAGAMSAVIGLDETRLNQILSSIDGVSVANYNAPDQIVITGTSAGVKAAEDAINNIATAESLKVRVIALAVGGAFHSPLMQAAAARFAEAIDAASFKDACIPVIQNINAKAVTKAEELKNNLKQQMTGAVQWTSTTKFLLGQVTNIVEIGPGKVLNGLVKKQDRRFPVINVEDVASLEQLLAVRV